MSRRLCDHLGVALPVPERAPARAPRRVGRQYLAHAQLELALLAAEGVQGLLEEGILEGSRQWRGGVKEEHD